MFDIFGEFDSFEEINATASGLKAEGDLENIKVLAKENGIDEYDAEDYIEGVYDTLCNAQTAAFGKIDIEVAELKPYEIMNDWINYIKQQISDYDEVARSVRKKGKSIKGCIGKLLKWSFDNAVDVDKDILKAAGVSTARVKLGIPGMGKAKEIIMDYYTK